MNTQTLSAITDGIGALACALQARLPDDFEWTFVFCLDELHVSYWWTGASTDFQKEMRSVSIVALLRDWHAINWDNERSAWPVRCARAAAQMRGDN